MHLIDGETRQGSPYDGRIVVDSARARLRTALACLDRIHGLPQYVIGQGTQMHRITFVTDESSEPVTGLGPIPPHATVEDVIRRAAEEARHAAQEALDEIDHALGWPR